MDISKVTHVSLIGTFPIGAKRAIDTKNIPVNVLADTIKEKVTFSYRCVDYPNIGW